MTIRVNIGCGSTPINGWINYDNSLAIKLANSPILYSILKLFKLLNKRQIKNIEWNKRNKIFFADATKKIPLEINSVECIYASHMLEHLSRAGALSFLDESIRVLKKNGVLRIAVPDLKNIINYYLAVNDADKFMERLYVEAPSIRSLKEKLKLFILGYRHHQWMYDGKSLSVLMKNRGFRNVVVRKSGETYINNLNGLNLYERSEESVYVEGIK